MAIKSRTKYTSKGGLGGRLAPIKSEKSAIDLYTTKMDAFRKGKHVYMTVPNPNPKETNKPFIRVEMKSLYGNFKNY